MLAEDRKAMPAEGSGRVYLHPFAQAVKVTVVQPLTTGVKALDHLPALQAAGACREASQVTVEVVVDQQRVSCGDNRRRDGVRDRGSEKGRREHNDGGGDR